MAYTAAVTLDTPRVQKTGRNVAMITGKCDITSYHQTGAEITDITKYFRTIQRVVCDGVSDNGYIVRWNTTDECFHAFYPSKALATHKHNFTVTKGAITASTELGLSADAVAATVNNNTIATTIALTTNSPVAAGGDVAAQAGTEVANDVDVGEVNFIAVGLL